MQQNKSLEGDATKQIARRWYIEIKHSKVMQQNKSLKGNTLK
jgi:hypothetical protein